MVAGVAEWQTRTTQNRVPKGVWVRLPPPAQVANVAQYGRGGCLRSNTVEVRVFSLAFFKFFIVGRLRSSHPLMSGSAPPFGICNRLNE